MWINIKLEIQFCVQRLGFFKEMWIEDCYIEYFLRVLYGYRDRNGDLSGKLSS